MNVRRISIARLHNLGNYEHIKFDVTVELPDGARDAGEVIHKLERLLGALAPVKTGYEYRNAVKIVAEADPERDLEHYRVVGY